MQLKEQRDVIQAAMDGKDIETAEKFVCGGHDKWKDMDYEGFPFFNFVDYVYRLKDIETKNAVESFADGMETRFEELKEITSQDVAE